MSFKKIERKGKTPSVKGAVQRTQIEERLPDDGSKVSADKALTGTTLRVYRYLVVQDKPVSAREVQRALGLSSPALAVFHLEKLVIAGLLTKENPAGGYLVEKIYLKHYVRLRRFLIPRYMFYAVLASLFTTGWFIILLAPTSNFWVGLHTGYAFTLISFAFYGIGVTAILAGIFWYETIKVIRNDKL